MSRLFDEIPDLHGLTIPATVVDISNVAEYYAMLDKPDWNYVRDVPNAAPPFPQAFYEMRAPRQKKMNGVIHTNPNPQARFGVLIRSLETDTPQFPYQFAKLALHFQGYWDRVKHQVAGAKWLCTAQSYCSFDRTQPPPTHPSFVTVYGVNERGVIHNCKDGFFSVAAESMVDPEVPMDHNLRMLEYFARELVNPCMLAISFLHCKNVERIENIPPPKIQAKRVNSGKLPLTKFYTLAIEPMKQVLQTEGNISTDGLRRALHICRGHFATYDEKPLFGKVKGTFWIPQHVKGSKDSGEIVKDYRIKP